MLENFSDIKVCCFVVCLHHHIQSSLILLSAFRAQHSVEIVHGVPGDSDSEGGAMGGKQSVARSARANGGIVHGSSSFDNGGFGVSGPNSAKKGTVGRPPMPTEPGELEVLFNKVLVQMDLPPERAKHLRSVIHSDSSDRLT